MVLAPMSRQTHADRGRPARAALSTLALLMLAGSATAASVLLPDGLPPDAPASAAREGYATADDGVRLRFRRVGTAGPVVLVPGDLFLHDDLRALARGRTLVFYDTRNRGRSDAVADSTTLTIEQDVRDLEAVRRHVGAERVSLVGFSYMGLLVAMYAAAHPARVERIVQIGPVPRRYGTEYPRGLTTAGEPAVPDSAAFAPIAELRHTGAFRDRPREYCEREWEVTRAALVGDPSRASRLRSPCAMENEWPVNLWRHLRHHFLSVQRAAFGDSALARVRAPVLVVHGTRDRNAPYGAGREWALQLPDARLLTVRGAAHAAWVDAPDAVLPAIDEFLSGRWPTAAERVTTLEGGA